MQASVKSDVKFDEAGLILLVESGFSQVGVAFFSYIDKIPPRDQHRARG